MIQNEDNIHDKNQSAKIKNGIARAKAQGSKLGRPTVAEVKGDANIATKAAELRSLGLSWSQIASKLGIGRTTARRLVTLYLKEKDIWTKAESNPPMPKYNVSNTGGSEDQHTASSFDDDILGKMPKTFQIFSKLLEKARSIQQNGGVI